MCVVAVQILKRFARFAAQPNGEAFASSGFGA